MKRVFYSQKEKKIVVPAKNKSWFFDSKITFKKATKQIKD